MKVKHHLQIYIFASIFWLLFYLAGLPDYYLQYSTKSMIITETILLIPFSIIIWIILKRVKNTRRIGISLWYSFYFTIPLMIYDFIYCGIYLGYGLNFFLKFWFLTVYYVIPWILFPTIAILLNIKTKKV